MKFRWESEFKETEIGEIPRDWEVSKAIEHIEFIRGIEPGSKFYKNFGKYKFIRVGNLSGERNEEVFIDIEVENEKIANKDDILISFDGTVGIVKKGLEGVFSSGIRKIKVKEQSQKKLNYKFLYWFFKSTLKNQIFGFSDEKTTIAHAGDSIPHLKIFLPPLSEQSRIAQVLSYFDDLIENKKKQSEILEKTAMAIFKSWFIDFEPFKDQEFVYNEELGKEIPKGWEVKRLSDIIEEIAIGEWGEDEPMDSTYKVFYCIRGTDIPSIKAGNSSLVIRFSNKKNLNFKFLKDGDIVIEVSGGSFNQQTGRALLVLKEMIESYDLPITCSNFCRILRFPNLSISMFAYLLLLYSYLTGRFYEFEEGTTSIKNLKFKDFISETKFAFSGKILQRLHSLIEPLFQKIILNQKQIMTLKKVRDTLLPLLVFGKLRVEEI
jgi:type I restriction enzyme S subunit